MRFDLFFAPLPTIGLAALPAGQVRPPPQAGRGSDASARNPAECTALMGVG